MSTFHPITCVCKECAPEPGDICSACGEPYREIWTEPHADPENGPEAPYPELRCRCE